LKIGFKKFMKATKKKSAEQWTSDWLGSVASGARSMSARKLTSIKKRGGGLRIVAAAAKKRKVHLLRLADDHGNELIAASTRPFKVIA